MLQIAQSVQRAVAVAKREKVFFPLNKAYSLPHRIDGYWGAAKVMLRPAADGAGVIAGELLVLKQLLMTTPVNYFSRSSSPAGRGCPRLLCDKPGKVSGLQA